AGRVRASRPVVVEVDVRAPAPARARRAAVKAAAGARAVVRCARRAPRSPRARRAGPRRLPVKAAQRRRPARRSSKSAGLGCQQPSASGLTTAGPTIAAEPPGAVSVSSPTPPRNVVVRPFYGPDGAFALPDRGLPGSRHAVLGRTGTCDGFRRR